MCNLGFKAQRSTYISVGLFAERNQEYALPPVYLLHVK